MKNHLLKASLLLTAFLFSCGGNDKEQEVEQTPDLPANVQEAMEQTQKTLEEAKLNQTVEPVNFRDLQASIMPEKVDGFDRSKMSGESTGAMGFKFSKAEATYTRDGKNIRLEIVDTGGLGMAMVSMAAWSTVTIDQEDESGYERTGTMAGYKTMEKYRKSNSNCELALLAEDRFILTANCRDCEMETVKSFLQALDLKNLKKI